MRSIRLLWVNFCKDNNLAAPYIKSHDNFRIYIVDSHELLSDAIDEVNPQIICFDYDYPELSGMTALQNTKQQFAKIPILMFTFQHSENLAVWAFRSRVWDYLVKPISEYEILDRVAILSRVILSDGINSVRSIVKPANPIPIESRFRDQSLLIRTLPAISYIEKNYYKKICVDCVAECCGLSSSSFSRIFKRENKMGFSEYLLRYRVDKAKELLQHPCAAVSDVAFTVGFKDPSYFSRIFRRYTGVSPSSIINQR